LSSSQQENTGCLVLDLRMGGMNGFELLRHLAATGSRAWRLPVLMSAR
jgi:FixJ family two-component response regulator